MRSQKARPRATSTYLMIQRGRASPKGGSAITATFGRWIVRERGTGHRHRRAAASDEERGTDMTLILTCPICNQGMAFRSNRPIGKLRCPKCEAPIRVPQLRLPEHEILSIVARTDKERQPPS